jgi:iron complex outermembrane receptor protein
LAGSVYAQDTAAVAPAPTTAADVKKEVKKDRNPRLSVRLTVSGIRRGIEAAISVKKNSTSIVEAISSEDIGKLPDSSVAESIARLPGVTAQRSRNSGKAADVSVRGLAPSFNGTLVNGREQASTGNARSPEFDLFPAELIGSALIYKTPDATVIGQGLAATIDLHTVQPLDFGKRVHRSEYPPRAQRRADAIPEGDGNPLHLLVHRPIRQPHHRPGDRHHQLQETGGGQEKFEGGGTDNSITYNGAPVMVPIGFKADTETRQSKRDGVSATLQFRPNKEFKSTVDLFYSSGEDR